MNKREKRRNKTRKEWGNGAYGRITGSRKRSKEIREDLPLWSHREVDSNGKKEGSGELG